MISVEYFIINSYVANLPRRFLFEAVVYLLSFDYIYKN